MSEQLIANINTIDITSHNGVTITLKNIFVSINIYESIFNNFTTGKIIIKDTFDIIQIFPLVGGEDLEISFTSQNTSEGGQAKLQNFKIYKVDKDSGVHKSEKDNKLLVLYFCSPEMIIDRQSSISKRWKGVPCSTPLSYILTNIFKSPKKLSQHSSSVLLDFVTNFWTPSKLISFLEEQAKGKYDDFIFYENKDGFNFHSISELMSKPYSHELKFEDTPDVLYDYRITKVKKMSKYVDILEGMKYGVYGNTFYKLEPFEYGFDKFQEDFVSVTKYTTSLGKHVHNNSELINNNSIHLTYADGHHITKRDLIIKALSKYHQIVKLNGDNTKTVGQIYKFSIPERAREKPEENELMTNNWFVTHINHELTSDGKYEMKVKLIKNAFFNFSTFPSVQGGKNL